LIWKAWEANQNRLEEESAKKKSKRAIGNWEKLVRGLLLKAKLENKYLKKPEKDENSGESSIYFSNCRKRPFKSSNRFVNKFIC
jgi:hypothetical protein